MPLTSSSTARSDPDMMMMVVWGSEARRRSTGAMAECSLSFISLIWSGPRRGGLRVRRQRRVVALGHPREEHRGEHRQEK